MQSKITPQYIETALQEHSSSRVNSTIVEGEDLTEFYSPNKGDEIGDAVHLKQVAEMLNDIVQSDIITDRERVVICHRFELLGHDRLSHKEIAPLIGCSRSNVQKIEVAV